MKTYAFILGRKYLLSIAELISVLGLHPGNHHAEHADHSEHIPSVAKIADITTEAFIVNLPDALKDPQASLNRLGGVIKIAEIFHEESANKADLGSVVSQYLTDQFKEQEGKLIYGLSLYSFPQNYEIILRKSLNFIKKELKSAEIKSRFINHNFKNLESAAIKGEKLLQKGAEIIAIQGHHKIFMGKTLAIQDFENYSHRDFDRPARDARLGMLPPKLAQIMINLGGLTSLESESGAGAGAGAKTVYDPFCGIGTVLNEGLLMGYNILGSDINPEVIKKAQQNLEWLRNNNFSPYQKTRIFQKDATTLTSEDLPETVDLVVTESFLGPPVSQLPTEENMKKTFNNIKETIRGFFEALSPLLKPGTSVVISILVYRAKNRLYFAEHIADIIERSGFQVAPLIPKDLRAKYGLGSHQSESLIYDRPDQIVGREIWKFVKK